MSAGPVLNGMLMTRTPPGLLAIAVLCCCTANGRADDWMTSKLTRFGVELSHPASFRRAEAAWEKPGFEGSISAGNADTISDGTMSVTLRGEPGRDRGAFESGWKGELGTRGSAITYKVKRNNWYVVSGVQPDGTEFYTKSWLLPHGGFQFEATYPHARNATYDRILERMLEGFTPTISGSDDTFEREPVPQRSIGEEEAVRIVADKLGFEPAKNRHLVFDHMQKRDGRDYFVVHGYDRVITSPDGTGHTATWGWYYVDARTGAARQWDLVDDKLLPIRPLKFR